MGDSAELLGAEQLVAKLRMEAGQSGAVEALQIIRRCDVFRLSAEKRLPYPIPTAGPDFFVEVLDALIEEANKP